MPGKKKRLSFRISNEMSIEIDSMIKKSQGGIRDRSEFGTKAVSHFIRYVKMEEESVEVIAKAILELAEKNSHESDAISSLKEMLTEVGELKEDTKVTS